MLYWRIETEYLDDGVETYRNLVDVNSDPEPEISGRWHIGYELATKEDTSLDDIANAIASEMEDKNYHNMTDIGYFVVKHLLKFLPEDQAKEILWSMIEAKGLAWTNF